jgi:hypothetical protein
VAQDAEGRQKMGIGEFYVSSRTKQLFFQSQKYAKNLGHCIDRLKKSIMSNLTKFGMF